MFYERCLNWPCSGPQGHAGPCRSDDDPWPHWTPATCPDHHYRAHRAHRAKLSVRRAAQKLRKKWCAWPVREVLEELA